jgi:hypothetical protein
MLHCRTVMASQVDPSSEKQLIHDLLSNKEAGDLQGRKVEDLKNRLEEIQKSTLFQKYLDLRKCSPHYSDRISIGQRVAATLVLVLLIGVVVGLILHNHSSLFTHIDYTKLGIGLGVTLVLITGSGIAIYRTCSKREELLGQHHLKMVTVDGNTTLMHEDAKVAKGAQVVPLDRKRCQAPLRGAFAGREKNIETVLVKCEAWTSPMNYYVDLSTVQESGKALLYLEKECDNHYVISTIVPWVATPLHMITSMVYHLLRAVIVPFYVLVQWLREQCTGVQLFKERRFHFVDIFIESGKSLWRAIKTPFNALAYIALYVYAFPDPIGGRLAISALQRDWNEGVSFDEGFWIPQACCWLGAQKFWKFEGGGGPETLGRNGVYWDGCQQPHGYVAFNDAGEVIAGYRMGAAFKSDEEMPLQVIFRRDLERAVEGVEEELSQLYDEYSAIKNRLFAYS